MARPHCYLISVMHTGTTFLQELLRPSLGFHHVHAHIEDKVLPSILLADVVVSPLRDPRSVWRSFCMRRQSPTYFWDGWENLAAIDGRHRVLYVPVDLPGVRDACLAAVGDALGLDIETNWAPRGEFREDREAAPPAEPADLSPVYALPLVARFYRESERPAAALYPALA